jgi:hypothetical protein
VTLPATLPGARYNKRIMNQAPEPRNPFYLLLLLASFLFVLTALAYAIVPTLEEKAKEAGEFPPPSPLRDALRQDGWRWLLIEVAAMVGFGLASMGLDRLRRLKKERDQATILHADEPPSFP